MKRAVKIIIPVVLAVAIVLCLAWYLFIYDREFTRDMLLSSARLFEGSGNHEIAEWFYDCAYAQAGDNDAVAIELANQHIKAGNFTMAERTLSQAIEDGGSVELYIALSNTYVQQDKLLDAVKLLDGVSNPEVQAELAALRPQAPTVAPAPGFYSQYISASLTAAGGTLYASTLGQFPSIKDAPYEAAIPLTDGENTIHAVCVAKNGLVSPLSIFGYTIGGVIQEVTFQDAAIEQAVRQQLNLGQETRIFTNNLWDIVDFTVPAEAQTLTDLQHFTFLETLTITKGPSGSLSSLSPLGNIRKLTITDTAISAEELAVIGGLTKLESLVLSGCSLSTAAGLEKAVNITYLDLSNNTIRNIQSLSSMSQLTELHLQHNALNDVSALSGLAKLETLDLSYNAITTLSPISGLGALTWLDAGHNQLTTATGISSLSYLVLANNQITDVSGLAGCTGLKELDISNNALTDISSLSSLINLTALAFAHNKVSALPALPKDCRLVSIDGSHNQLTSVEQLGGMQHLNTVSMDYNSGLSSISALAKCPVLIQVNVFGTNVKNVSSLTSQSIVVNYDPS